LACNDRSQLPRASLASRHQVVEACSVPIEIKIPNEWRLRPNLKFLSQLATAGKKIPHMMDSGRRWSGTINGARLPNSLLMRTSARFRYTFFASARVDDLS
jgi:hypothetical protein